MASSNRFIWLKKWVIERHTLDQISKLSGYSIRTLKRYFHQYLSKPPVLSVYPSEKVNLLIDGTYFNSDLCLVLYRNNQLTTGRYWYKHKFVIRSFMVIKKALPDMFRYLDNDRVPKSTNGLESLFGHLKGHLAIHRGLSVNHRKNYIQWYLYFKNATRSDFFLDHILLE